MKRFLLAQVTDMHVKAVGKLSYRVVDAGASLARCIEHLLKIPQRPDAVLFTGDLTDFGGADEYDNLRSLLAPLPMPVFLMPGNHDKPEAMRAAFPGHAYLRQRPGRIDYVIEDFPVRLVALDSTVPRESGGALRPAQLTSGSTKPWLRLQPSRRLSPSTIHPSGPASGTWTAWGS